MLKLKPSDRPSIAECLQHDWLRTTDDRNMKEALEALRKFNARRRFRKGITAIRTTNFLKKIVALKSTSSQSELTAVSHPTPNLQPEGPDEVGKYFRVYDDALSGSLKKLEACSAGSDQMLKQLASNPELSNSMAPAMANIFKLMTLMEKDFKAFRKAYAQAYLPPAQKDVADYL